MSLGSLIITLAANTASFEKDLGRATNEAEARMNAMAEGARKAGAVIGVAMVAAAGTMAALVKQAINNADAMSKMAQSTGINISTLSELNYVAGLSGVSTEALATSVGKLNRNIVDAAAGTGDSVRAFKALDIEVKTAGGSLKSADEVMGEVADKFKTFADGPEKSALAMMMFGKAGAAMIPMLNQGSVEMKKMRDEARELGVTLDTETGQAAERFNDNLTRLNTVKAGLANTIMRMVLPQMNAFTDAMVDAAKATKVFEGIGNGVKVLFQTLAVVGSDVAFVFKMIGGEIGVWAAQIAALARGDFKGFKLISEEWTKDAAQARKDLDEFQKRIMGVYEVAAGGAMDMGAAMGDVFRKGKGPSIQSTEQLKAAQIKAEKQMTEDLRMARQAAALELEAFVKAEKDAIFVAEQWEAQMADEIKIMSEVAHWTSFYRNAQLEAEKAINEARITSMSEFYEREQEMALEQGAILASGPSHTMKLEALRVAMLSEEQIEREAFEKKVERLAEFTDLELEALGGRHALLEQMQSEHEERMFQVRGRHNTLNLASARTFFGSMSVLMNTKSKELFAIGKAAAIGETVINTYRAAVGAYSALASIPIVGPALGAAAAAAAIAFGMAQVGAIRGQSFGGGAGAGGAVPVVASNPTTGLPSGTPGDVGQGQTTVVKILRIEGMNDNALLSGKQVRQLLEQLAENSTDGGRVVIA